MLEEHKRGSVIPSPSLDLFPETGPGKPSGSTGTMTGSSTSMRLTSLRRSRSDRGGNRHLLVAFASSDMTTVDQHFGSFEAGLSSMASPLAGRRHFLASDAVRTRPSKDGNESKLGSQDRRSLRAVRPCSAWPWADRLFDNLSRRESSRSRSRQGSRHQRGRSRCWARKSKALPLPGSSRLFKRARGSHGPEPVRPAWSKVAGTADR